MTNSKQTNVTDDVAEAAHQAVDRIAANAAKAEEQIREAANRAEQQIRASTGRAFDTTEELKKTATKQIHDHPLASVGIAFLIGYLFSVLFRR